MDDGPDWRYLLALAIAGGGVDKAEWEADGCKGMAYLSHQHPKALHLEWHDEARGWTRFGEVAIDDLRAMGGGEAVEGFRSFWLRVRRCGRDEQPDT